VLVLWALHRLGLTERLTLGLLVTAVGALLVPLVLAAVRGVCGELAARRYAPVLMLRPYAVWVAVSVDVVVAVLGAAMVAMGVRASAPHADRLAGRRLGLACGSRSGWPPCSRTRRRGSGSPWCACTSPAAGRSSTWPPAWARCSRARRAAGRVQLAGRTLVARADYAARVEPNRSALAWSAISVVVLLLAAGPPLVRSLRRSATPPAGRSWSAPASAVAFSILAGWPGAGRGGLAAVLPLAHGGRGRPDRPGRRPAPSPLLLSPPAR
jgi:hypothetical protein